MNLGYSTWGMPTVPIDVAIPHIAQLGFDGMELAVGPRFITELSTLDAAERKRIAGLLKQTQLSATGNRCAFKFNGNRPRSTRTKYVATERCSGSRRLNSLREIARRQSTQHQAVNRKSGTTKNNSSPSESVNSLNIPKRSE